VGVKKGLSNFAFLRTVGQRINGRLLALERTAHDCGRAAARLSDVTQPRVADLLAVPDTQYTCRQMGYDLRRLARKGFIARLDGKLCNTLTPYGRRTALFLTKVHARVLRPGFQALDPQHFSQAPPRLRTPSTPPPRRSSPTPGWPHDLRHLCADFAGIRQLGIGLSGRATHWRVTHGAARWQPRSRHPRSGQHGAQGGDATVGAVVGVFQIGSRANASGGPQAI
jgi:hypothetical protein